MRIIRKVTKQDWKAIEALAAEFKAKYGPNFQDDRAAMSNWPAGLDRVLGTVGAVDVSDTGEYIVGENK